MLSIDQSNLEDLELVIKEKEHLVYCTPFMMNWATKKTKESYNSIRSTSDSIYQNNLFQPVVYLCHSKLADLIQSSRGRVADISLEGRLSDKTTLISALSRIDPLGNLSPLVMATYLNSSARRIEEFIASRKEEWFNADRADLYYLFYSKQAEEFKKKALEIIASNGINRNDLLPDFTDENSVFAYIDFVMNTELI